jgi:hypothetical protein
MDMGGRFASVVSAYCSDQEDRVVGRIEGGCGIADTDIVAPFLFHMRIRDRHASKLPAILRFSDVENVALTFDRRSDDASIVPSHS